MRNIILITFFILVFSVLSLSGISGTAKATSEAANGNAKTIGKDSSPPSNRIPHFSNESGPFDMNREADGRLQIFSFQLCTFRGMNGRDPETMQEFIDSPAVIFWPVCPYTGKPYQYVDEISPNADSLDKFSFETHNGKKWILGVIEMNGQFQLVNYPNLPSMIFLSCEKAGRSLANDSLKILSVYLKEQVILPCLRYVWRYGKLPTSFHELMNGFLIVRDNWPDMSNLKSIEDDGFFEIGITSDGLKYYQLVHVPGDKIIGYGMPFVISNHPIRKMYPDSSLDIPCRKHVIDTWENKVPIASSLMFPTAESLPDEMCITKAEILGSK